MNIDFKKLSGRTPGIMGNRKMFRAAVCIPLIKTKNSYNLLFEIRSATIPDQPGDVCFPGGGLEGEETPEQGAVRELCEELLVTEKQFHIIGKSDIFHTENTIVYPIIGLLNDYAGTFDPVESADVFEVPIEFFLNTEPEVYEMKFVPSPPDNFPFDRIVGGRNYKWRNRTMDELFYEYEGRIIWGMTARITKRFVDILKNGYLEDPE